MAENQWCIRQAAERTVPADPECSARPRNILDQNGFAKRLLHALAEDAHHRVSERAARGKTAR